MLSKSISFTKRLSLIILLLLAMGTNPARAGEGCIINPYLYFYRDGTALDGKRNFGYLLAPSPSRVEASLTCNRTFTGNGCHVDGNILINGTHVSAYIICPVPIDDHVPFILLGIGAIGFVWLKRKNIGK